MLDDLTWWFFGKRMARQTEKQREQCYRHFGAQKQDVLTVGASLFLCVEYRWFISVDFRLCCNIIKGIFFPVNGNREKLRPHSKVFLTKFRT